MVQDQQVTRSQYSGKIPKDTFSGNPTSGLDQKQPGIAPAVGRVLGDQLRWQIKIVMCAVVFQFLNPVNGPDHPD